MVFSYDPETESIIVTYHTGEYDETKKILVSRLLEMIPGDLARLEYLKARVHEIRMNKLETINAFMGEINDIAKDIARITSEQMELLETPELITKDLLKLYEQIIKSLLARKTTLAQNRLAIGRLNNEEGRILASIAEIDLLVE